MLESQKTIEPQTVTYQAMLQALQEIRRDPKHKKLSSKAFEALQDALAAAE